MADVREAMELGCSERNESAKDACIYELTQHCLFFACLDRVCLPTYRYSALFIFCLSRTLLPVYLRPTGFQPRLLST